MNVALTAAGVYPTRRRRLDSTLFIGELVIFAGATIPPDYYSCDGRSLTTSGNAALYSVIGTAYGSATGSFNIPDLRGRTARSVSPTSSAGTKAGAQTVALTTANMAAHSHSMAPTGSTFSTGSGTAFDNKEPTLTMKYIISTDTSVYPTARRRRLTEQYEAWNETVAGGDGKDDPASHTRRRLQSGEVYLGQIMLWAGNTIPTGWVLCDGQTLSRTANSALFALIGTTYGAGDGSTTFGKCARARASFLHMY